MDVGANTSTLLLQQPLEQLLQGRQREDVVVNLSLTTTSGMSYQGNCFLCLQKDLRLQPVTPRWQVDPAQGGCAITIRADRFVRALCLSVDDGDSHFDNNYFDVLPGVPVRCFLKTTLSAEQVRQSLSFQSLNQMNGHTSP